MQHTNNYSSTTQNSMAFHRHCFEKLGYLKIRPAPKHFENSREVRKRVWRSVGSTLRDFQSSKFGVLAAFEISTYRIFRALGEYAKEYGVLFGVLCEVSKVLNAAC